MVKWNRTITARTLTPEEAAWVGAMIEAEGTVAVYIYPGRTGKNEPRMVFVSTDIETTATIFRLLGFGGVYRSNNAGATFKANKHVWRWQSSRAEDIKFALPQLIPYLTSKKERAIDVIEACS